MKRDGRDFVQSLESARKDKESIRVCGMNTSYRDRDEPYTEYIFRELICVCKQALCVQARTKEAKAF